MSQALEYHLVVHALEARSGWTAMSRFASAVTHTIEGHLPYARYHAAGVASERRGARAGEVDGLISDWLATDLNPITQVVRGLPSADQAVRTLNAYTSGDQVGVRTVLDWVGTSGLPGHEQLVLSRELVSSADDPEPCRLGGFSIMTTLVESASRQSAQPALAGRVRRLSDVAHHLGVERSAAAEVSAVFEREGSLSIAEVAQRVGCGQRTLERRLRAEGLTAELLRRAARLVRATDRLASDASLTTIAVDEGFSDLAHMSRTFKVACGMSPGKLRRVAGIGDKRVLHPRRGADSPAAVARIQASDRPHP